eukprot:760839-Amphidinium_carterae.1
MDKNGDGQLSESELNFAVSSDEVHACNSLLTQAMILIEHRLTTYSWDKHHYTYNFPFLIMN